MNIRVILSLIAILGLTISCAKSADVVYKYPKAKEDREREEMGSFITGDNDPIEIIGGKGVASSKSISTNTYLWQAALEAISFMPIASSDSHGGTIITDWYSDEKFPNERFKFNIIISSNALEAVALKVNGFKQVRSNGDWKNIKMNENVTKDLEIKILTRARKMKISNM